MCVYGDSIHACLCVCMAVGASVSLSCVCFWRHHVFIETVYIKAVGAMCLSCVCIYVCVCVYVCVCIHIDDNLRCPSSDMNHLYAEELQEPESLFPSIEITSVHPHA